MVVVRLRDMEDVEDVDIDMGVLVVVVFVIIECGP